MNEPTFYKEEDFLKVRKQGIGASDVANICGVGYGSPLQVFLEKTGRTTVEDNAAMRRGRRFEPLILEEFKEEFDVENLLVPENGQKLIWRHPKYEWAFCHPDALIVDKDNKPTALVQAKLTGLYNGWGTMALGEIPEHIQYQVQWEMFCSGLSVDYVPVLMGNRDFRIYHCKELPELQESIFEAVSSFKKDFLDKDEMPEPTGSKGDTEAIKSLFPQSQEKEATPTAELIAMVGELKTFKNELSIAKEIHDEIVNRLKVEMGDAQVLITDDCKITFKTQERKTYDYKKLLSDLEVPADKIESYKKVSTSRPFKPVWRNDE